VWCVSDSYFLAIMWSLDIEHLERKKRSWETSNKANCSNHMLLDTDSPNSLLSLSHTHFLSLFQGLVVWEKQIQGCENPSLIFYLSLGIELGILEFIILAYLRTITCTRPWWYSTNPILFLRFELTGRMCT
jgi:hypothetical protein